MSELIVCSGGLSTTVQDSGRDGHYAIGMPPSGAMDQFSCAVGNMLVGNPDGAAALEATYLGPRLEFTDSRAIAVTGADSAVHINDSPVEQWSTLRVSAGDVLSFGMIKAGARPYIAISGGIGVAEYLGSRSTYTLTGIGGFCGRSLAEGDRVPLGPRSESEPSADSTVPETLRPDFPNVIDARLVVGLCSYRMTETALESFLNTTWKVTKDADRVGYRLRGGEIEFIEREQPFGAGNDPANVVDLGYPIGSIQVPGGDEPIVLLNDAVTGGGYATIGTVITADLDRIAQAKTGGHVTFHPVDIETALTARRDRRDRIEKARHALSPQHT